MPSSFSTSSPARKTEHSIWKHLLELEAGAARSAPELTCRYAVEQRQDADGLPLLGHDWGVNLWCLLKCNHKTEKEHEDLRLKTKTKTPVKSMN